MHFCSGLLTKSRIPIQKDLKLGQCLDIDNMTSLNFLKSHILIPKGVLAQTNIVRHFIHSSVKQLNFNELIQSVHGRYLPSILIILQKFARLPFLEVVCPKIGRLHILVRDLQTRQVWTPGYLTGSLVIAHSSLCMSVFKNLFKDISKIVHEGTVP